MVWGLCLHHCCKFLLESCNWLEGAVPLFFGAKVSWNIFTFIQTNTISSQTEETHQISQHRPISLLHLSKPGYISTSPTGSFTWVGILQYLLTKPQPVSFHWVDIPLNISINPSLVSFNWVYIPGYLSTKPLPVSFNGRRQVPIYLFIANEK